MLVEPTLDAARLALDDALRTALANRLAAPASPDAPAGPDAEADALALRRLLAGADAAQRAVILAVWGRIAGATGPLVVHGSAAALLAADRHGLTFQTVADADAALGAVEAGARALIDLDGRPWWGRLLARPALRVVAALPDDPHGRPRALMIAREPGGPTGDDRTFWVTDSAAPEVRIIEALTACGFAAQPLTASAGLKLFMLAGYVQVEDGRLPAAPGALKGVIGAAPVH